MGFGQQVRKARTELLALHTSCTIEEPHFINKFLTGLGPSFDLFRTTFNQTHYLIPTRVNGVDRAATTFEEALLAASREESAMKQREERRTANVSGGTSSQYPFAITAREGFTQRRPAGTSILNSSQAQAPKGRTSEENIDQQRSHERARKSKARETMPTSPQHSP